MNLGLIKAGKIGTVLRREGFLPGGTRILRSIGALFQPVSAGDILLITGGVGDSARYRAWHVAEDLALAGFRTSVAVQGNLFLKKATEKFSVFIFHRVAMTQEIALMVENIKKTGKAIIFDADDLVFDPQYFRERSYFKNMGTAERHLYEKGIGSEILNDPYVEVCTAPTSFIVKLFEEKRKRAFLVPNKLSRSDVILADGLAKRPKKRSRTVTLGYFSGSATHDDDFATIAEPLSTLLALYPHVGLRIVGPLVLPENLRPYADRIESKKLVSWKKHFEEIAAVDINLAPLVMGDPFCEAKSELKFFEAGMLGVPTVAARTQTFREAISEGKDGFTAATPQEWRERLEELIATPELREEVGKAARATALRQYTTDGRPQDEYTRYLALKIRS